MKRYWFGRDLDDILEFFASGGDGYLLYLGKWYSIWDCGLGFCIVPGVKMDFCPEQMIRDTIEELMNDFVFSDGHTLGEVLMMDIEGKIDEQGFPINQT